MQLQTPKTPTMLARESHTSLANISRTLHELRKKGLVACITPRVRVGKIFALTDKGKRVSAKIKKMEGG